MLQIFTTGGTIDKVYFDAKSEYEVGPPQIDRILDAVAFSEPYAVETLMRKDSLDMTDVDRAKIRAAVESTTARCVLITHGTDTMVETGLALAGLPDKTIVLVGSLSPARFVGSDAEFNIGFALAAAQTLGPGVYVAMNGRVFDVNHVRKNREANRFEAV
jgi:L-asparaginase